GNEVSADRAAVEGGGSEHARGSSATDGCRPWTVEQKLAIMREVQESGDPVIRWRLSRGVTT
ncbi:hypothetical protein ACWGS9_35255, partial [Bradyrhizobium sp. Arg314]